MTTHGVISERSVSDSLIDHIGKGIGREGKGGRSPIHRRLKGREPRRMGGRSAAEIGGV